MADHNLTTDSLAYQIGTEVHLEGGPDSIPRKLVVTEEEVAYGKVKVPHLAGYEHFVRKITDDARFLFSWSTRTKIAE